MVNSLSHFGVGFLIAAVLGFKGWERICLGLLAVLPDLDFIPNFLFFAIEDMFSYEVRTQLFYIMVHREFFHSLLFILIVTVILWLWKKNNKFTIAGFFVLLSHFFLDYATSWKMRPMYPFVEEASTLGSIDFFDPIVTIISLIPVAILLLDYRFGRLKEINYRSKLNRLTITFKANEKQIYQVLFIVLLVWCAITPFTKLLLVSDVAAQENTELVYQDTYPIAFGKFLTAYSYNESHYKVMEISYWSGIEQSVHVPKIANKGTSSSSDAMMSYVKASYDLYSTTPGQQIDFPVFSVYKENDSIEVTIRDARSEFVLFWTYFVVEYKFVFDSGNPGCNYTAYYTDQQGETREVPNNWFLENDKCLE